MIDFNDFFIHQIQLVEKQSLPNGSGGRIVKDVGVGEIIKVFLDTPNSEEIFRNNQLQENEFDRYLYCTYDIKIPRGKQIQELENGSVLAKYIVQGKPEDQGGQRQFYRIGLKEVL